MSSYYYGSYYDNKKIKRRKRLRIAFAILMIIVLAVCLLGFGLYKKMMKPNTWTPNNDKVSIYIASNSNFDQVKDTLYTKGLIINRNTFEWVAEYRNYPEQVKPGHYVIKNGMNNFELVNQLNSGMQTPVKVTFNNVRDIKQLAEKVSEQIEADQQSIIELLSDSAFIGQLGFNQQTIPALFIPNTYEFYWNCDANKFISRMLQEYRFFWNEDRRTKAENLGLTPLEVSTLASIVEKETTKVDEMPTIAGLYLNRLNRHWRLQADPTLVFAAGNFEIKRVLDVHKQIDSPYNTYKYKGLPPGPIYIPSPRAIDAVLNAENHKYMYMCAREDMSGYHNFAKTDIEHQQNAVKYRRALDNLHIR